MVRILDEDPRTECPQWSKVRGTPEAVRGVWGFCNLPEAASNPDWERREEWLGNDEMKAFDPGNSNSFTGSPPVCEDAREIVRYGGLPT